MSPIDKHLVGRLVEQGLEEYIRCLGRECCTNPDLDAVRQTTVGIYRAAMVAVQSYRECEKVKASKEADSADWQ